MIKTILVILMIPAITLADCKKTPELCDKIVSESRQIIKEQQDQIKDYSNQSNLQRQIIADKDSQLASPLRDPVKVAAGTVIVVLVVEILTGVFR